MGDFLDLSQSYGWNIINFALLSTCYLLEFYAMIPPKSLGLVHRGCDTATKRPTGTGISWAAATVERSRLQTEKSSAFSLTFPEGTVQDHCSGCLNG